jgi:hypothetical protein
MESGMSKIDAEYPSRSRKIAVVPRSMKHWLAALAVLTAASGAGPCLAQDRTGAAAAELDPEQLAIANQVIDLSFPPEGRHATLMSMADTMTDQVRAAVAEVTGGDNEAMTAIMQRFLDRMRVLTDRAIAEHSPALFAAMARAYARNFTRDELVQIRAFVSTPTGRKYLQKSMEMLADPDVARANTVYMTSIFTAMEPMRVELRRELEAYIRSRPGRPVRDRPNGTR